MNSSLAAIDIHLYGDSANPSPIATSFKLHSEEMSS